jgi:hypothetical protein
MKEVWTAQLHLLTPPAPSGDTKCFVNVVAWASSEKDFTSTVRTILSRRNWTIVDVQHCMRAAECKPVMEELCEQIQEAKRQPGSCIFGTLHYYRSRPA